MRDAINKLSRDPEYIERQPRYQRQFRLEGTGLRDVLLKSFSRSEETDPKSDNSQYNQDPRHFIPEKGCTPDSSQSRLSTNGALGRNQLIQSWSQRYRSLNPVVVEGDPPLGHLNSSQIRAMAMMIGERISLIQGPPGTGKTKTIVETVKLLKGHFEVPHPILVSTYTNVAIDNLLEGFAGGGLKPLRVGTDSTTKDDFQEFTFDYQFQLHPRKTGELDFILAEIDDVDAEKRKLKDDTAKILNMKRKSKKAKAELGEQIIVLP